MSSAWLAGQLDVLAHRVATEIENVHARMGTNSDATNFGVQLDSLKYNIKFEFEAIKSELCSDNKNCTMSFNANEEIRRLQEELSKSKDIIKLHQLTESIAQQIEEKFNLNK